MFCKRGLKPQHIDQAVLPFHSNWQTRAAWMLRQWRPVVASQWMNIVTSFRGHLGHLHRNHYVLLYSQKFWMFSQMPPAVQMSATLPSLKIHHRCPLAHSSRLLLWQTFFQGADDITQIRERTIKAINPWWYLLLDKKTRLEPWIFMFSSPSLLLEHCPPHDPVLLLFDCCFAWRMSTWSWNTNWDSKTHPHDGTRMTKQLI